MSTIVITNGFTSWDGKLYSSKSGPVKLPAAVAASLVERGVAVYVETPLANCQEARCGKCGGGSCANPSGSVGGAEGAVTGESGNDHHPPASQAPSHEGEGFAEEDCIDVVDGHMTVESLLRLTRKELEKLASDLGTDASKCKNKSEIAALIAQVEVEAPEYVPADSRRYGAQDSEQPPALGAELPQ